MCIEIQDRSDEKRIYLTDPQLEDIRKTVKVLEDSMGHNKEYPWQKIKVKFSQPVELLLNRRKRKLVTEIYLRFFDSKEGNFCYTINRSTGYPLHYIPYSKIFCMSISQPTSKENKNLKLENYLKKFHPNAWDDIKKKKDIDPDRMKTINIKSKFPAYVIEELKNAFENKTKYHYKSYGKRRDLSVETKLCEDGIFRAWYSSEYAGCGNGAYYILIAPTIANFVEYD